MWFSTCWAIKLTGGARQGVRDSIWDTDDTTDSGIFDDVESVRGFLAALSSSSHTSRASSSHSRFLSSFSIPTSTSLTPALPLSTFQRGSTPPSSIRVDGSLQSSLMTIIMPGVPAHLRNVSFPSTHLPHIRDSYVEEERRGDGRSFDALESISPTSFVSLAERSGVGDRSFGRVRRLRQDSWYQSSQTTHCTIVSFSRLASYALRHRQNLASKFWPYVLFPFPATTPLYNVQCIFPTPVGQSQTNARLGKSSICSEIETNVLSH